MWNIWMSICRHIHVSWRFFLYPNKTSGWFLFVDASVFPHVYSCSYALCRCEEVIKIYNKHTLSSWEKGAAHGMQHSTAVVIYNFLSCSPHESNKNMDFLHVFFSPCIPSSCLIVSYPSGWLFLLKFSSLFSFLLSDPSLSLCLGCVWPCLSLPLQEVVSRLIESRLRSLELNTCSEELLFNCSSHTLLLVRTHKAHTCCVWSDPKPLPCSCSVFFLFLFFIFVLHGRGEMNEKKGEVERWMGSVEEECASGDGPRQTWWSCDRLCVLQAGQAEVFICERAVGNVGPIRRSFFLARQSYSFLLICDDKNKQICKTTHV